MAKTNIVDWNTITNFVIDSFVGYGVPRADAEICADVLLESDKRGITVVTALSLFTLIESRQVSRIPLPILR